MKMPLIQAVYDHMVSEKGLAHDGTSSREHVDRARKWNRRYLAEPYLLGILCTVKLNLCAYLRFQIMNSTLIQRAATTVPAFGLG